MKKLIGKIKNGNWKISAVMFLVALGCSGCASMFSPKTYPIQVNSATEGAVCTVAKEGSGEVIFQGQTPCTVMLPPGDKDYAFRVNGQEQKVRHQQNPAVLANLIFGPFGIFGMIIDMSTGNAWEYSKKPLCFN